MALNMFASRDVNFLMHGRPMRPLYAKGLLPKTNEKFFRGT
jgi:hypothetical protein